MFASKRLLCVTIAALCWSAAAASAQNATPVPPPDAAARGVAPLPNAVTPSPPRGDILPDPTLPDPRRADDRSPLLNDASPGNPRDPLLPNASPDEPPLRAPLLEIQ